MKRWVAKILSVILVLTVVVFPAGAAGTHSFRDVSRSHWASGAIQYVYENDLMNGTSSTTFQPDGILDRAMFVTILGRLFDVRANQNVVSTFPDVPTGQWYSGYVAWAQREGIVAGDGGKLLPESPVTREQMATMISRFLSSEGIRLPNADVVPSSFRDAGFVSDWAREGVELMRKTGIISGDSNGYFNPHQSATRAEAAMVFMRLSAKLGFAPEIDSAGELYLMEYDRTTLPQLKRVWGYDIDYEGYWEGGPMYSYNDDRTSVLYFVFNEQERLTVLISHTDDNLYINSKIPSHITYPELNGIINCDLQYENDPENIWQSSTQVAYVRLGDANIEYAWIGHDPYTAPADEILIDFDYYVRNENPPNTFGY